MKITRATTELRCDKCKYLKIANKDTMFKNDQKPWILICPYSGLTIKTVPTEKGLDEQKLPDLPAPWNCKLRNNLRNQNTEINIELSINCL